MLGGPSESAEDFTVSGDRMAVDGAARPVSGGPSARRPRPVPSFSHLRASFAVRRRYGASCRDSLAVRASFVTRPVHATYVSQVARTGVFRA